MKVEKGEITEDDASKLIGQQLFKRFVEPVVKPETPAAAPPLSYAAYYNELPTSSLLRAERESDGSMPDSNK